MRKTRTYRDRFFLTLVREFGKPGRFISFLRSQPLRRNLMWQFCRICSTQAIPPEPAAAKWFDIYARPQL